MKMLSKSLFIGVCVLAFAGLSFNAAADSHEAPPNLANLWVVHVKSGMSAQFEAAFKEHMAFREAAGDPNN